METWTQRFPGRLEHELEAFRERGLDFEVDRRSLKDQGRVILRGVLARGDEGIGLDIVYPDLFPYLRPEVYAPALVLDRHQDPYSRNLCLLDRSPGAWTAGDTAAWLVAERVPHLLDLLEAGGEQLRAGEAPQGEPISAYFPWQVDAVVFVPQEALALDPDATGGAGRLLCRLDEPPQLKLRGLVGELVVKEQKRKVRTVASADRGLVSRFQGAAVPFRWTRVDHPPDDPSAAGVLAAAEAAQPGIVAAPYNGVADGHLAICGIVFKEEVRQGEYEDAWLFAARGRRLNGQEIPPYIIASERLTIDDLGARIPTVATLADKTIAIIGAGALGSAVTMELARAQVGELRVLDHDHVETGTTVRWEMGLSAVRRPKVDALRDRIEADHPFTRLVPFRHQLGQSALMLTGRKETELDLVGRLLDGVDLVIDATADLAIQQLVTATAETNGIPQVVVSATEGARGGLVASILPGLTGCWLCLQWHLETGSLPIPPRDDDGSVQPRGCASPTFTGTRFDLLPMVAQTCRAAASVLAGTSTGGVSICSLSPLDEGSPPSWESQPLHHHPDCQACSVAAVA